MRRTGQWVPAMKSVLLSVLIAVKLLTFAALAFAAVEGETLAVAAPAGMSAATEPLSGGYRRKVEDDRWPD